jgi:hypothetical protein
MNNYKGNETEIPEDLVLSDDQRSSLQAIQAPPNLRDKIQQQVAASHSQASGRRTGFPQLAAAGLLGFLSFLGAQSLVSQLGGPKSAGLEVNNPATKEVSDSESVRNYHLQGVALMSTSDRYLDTLGPVGQSPEAVLATYMHQRGGENE